MVYEALGASVTTDVLPAPETFFSWFRAGCKLQLVSFGPKHALQPPFDTIFLCILQAQLRNHRTPSSMVYGVPPVKLNLTTQANKTDTLRDVGICVHSKYVTTVILEIFVVERNCKN